jgi:hypothetical protein
LQRKDGVLVPENGKKHAHNRILIGWQKTSLRVKSVFLALAISGLVLHYLAIYLTKAIIVSGTGQEGNPLFYIMGSSNFVLFGFMVLGGYYAVDWILNVPNWYKIVGASWLTGLTAFDFAHDLLFFLGYSGPQIGTYAHLIISGL